MANGMFTPQGYMTPEQVLQMTGFDAGAFAPQRQGLSAEDIQQQLEAASTQQGPTGLGAFAYTSPDGKSPQIGSQQLETGMEQGGIAANIRNFRARNALAELSASGVDLSTAEGAKKAGDVLMSQGLADQAQAQYARAAEIQKANLPSPDKSKWEIKELKGTDEQGKDVYENWLTKDGVPVKLFSVGGRKKEGTTINLGKEADKWNTIADNYRQDMKDVFEDRGMVDKVRTTIERSGGASAQALQASIANLFGGNARAQAELERWANFGNLPERVINSASRFFSGEYSETARTDLLRLLKGYEKEYLNTKQDKINERYKKVSRGFEVDPEMIITPTPERIYYDFSKMSPEDIANIDPRTLDIADREDLENRLTELGY